MDTGTSSAPVERADAAAGCPSGEETRCRRGPRVMASVSPLPPPAEIFIDWLMSVPVGADLAAAACKQIGLIDRRAPLHPDARCLRMLLSALAGSAGSSRLPAY